MAYYRTIKGFDVLHVASFIRVSRTDLGVYVTFVLQKIRIFDFMENTK